MDCGGALTPAWAKVALVKFNLPTLQNPVQIQRAYISLYKTAGSGSYGVSANRVTSNWTSAVTYNTRPTFSSTPESETTVSSTIGWYDFDITNSAGQWYLSSTPNYGTMLTTYANFGVTYAFDSSESTGDTKPKLTIIYSPSYIDPRHTTYDLGEFAGHTVQATLDKARAEVDITDLAIASWGPEASLSRHYSSAVTTSSKYAPGWRFGFQRNLTFTSSTRTDYVDEAGEVHTFTYDGTLWHAPAGLVASLEHPGSTWTLTYKNGPTLEFDSTGKLTSATDRNGNAVTYGWGTNSLTITAANAQQIQVSFNTSGKITGATYATVDGTRQVNYTTASPWQVTYFPGQSMAHTVTYTYTSNRLTEIKALSFTSLAGDAKETFHYDSMDRLDYVRFPDYASSVPNYNSSNTDARALFSYTSTSATVTTYGAVRTTSTITGQTGTPITQVFSWNPCGAMTSKTNPKSSGAYQTWTYTYSDDTNYLLSETSPLSTTRSWTYDSRGNLLTETDELSHTTTYTYPTSDADPDRDLPLTVTDPRGAVTTYEYDSAGNTTEMTRTLNQEATDNLADTIYVYGDVTVGTATYHGALLEEQKLVVGTTWAVTDYNTDAYYPNGANKATVKRDVVLAEGGPAVDLTEQSIYTAFGDPLERIDASGQSIESNEYDFIGRLLQRSGAWFTATVDGTSETTSIIQCYNYDAWGHAIESWTSSMNDVTGEIADWSTTTYDASGRPSVVTNKLWTDTVPAGQVQSTVTYRYDGRGLEITQANSTASGQPDSPPTLTQRRAATCSQMARLPTILRAGCCARPSRAIPRWRSLPTPTRVRCSVILSRTVPGSSTPMMRAATRRPR
jgi:YD repeat-containing protein